MMGTEVLALMEFTSEESVLLREVLEEDLKRLQIEINRTDAHDFKEQLRDRSHLLESIARKIGSHSPLVQ